MVNEPDATPIHKQYAERFSADLDINRKEQEDLSARITELGARLEQLKADENWLCGMRDAVPAATAVGATAVEAATGTVPQPRQAKKTTGATRARKVTQAKKAAVAAASDTKAKTPSDAKANPVSDAKADTVPDAKATTASATKAKTATRKAAVRKPTTTAAKKTTGAKTSQAEPPLRELVLALLVSAAEPRLVSEVGAELAKAHPGRPASTQVVRNTLETLAKKNLIDKEHKQGSVMYSAPRPAASKQAAAPAAVTASAPADDKAPANA